MEGHLTMSGKERKRKDAFVLVKACQWTLKQACETMGLSYRQGLRSYARWKAEGDAGLVHRGRGRPSSRRKDASLRAKTVMVYREQFARLEMGPTLASEHLAALGHAVDHETLRRWLVAEGLWQRRRARPKHRSWRERKACFGQMVQLDGSPHHWFGPDGPEDCLMDLIDDATNKTVARLAKAESTESAMKGLWKWIDLYGIPQSVYTDRHRIYVTDREPTPQEQLNGEPALTAFGKACGKLGIAIIAAHSPQAKGRVERRHAVFQDRLVKELDLLGITTIEGANAYLEKTFLPDLNKRFVFEPREKGNVHRPVPKGMDLADVFCHEETRTLTNDWTLSWENQRYQILEGNRPLPKPKDKILVRRRLDGTLHLLFKGKRLNYRLLSDTVAALRKTKPPARTAAKSGKPSKPMPKSNHPWRKPACRTRAAR